MSKIFVGAKAQNLDIGAEVAAITRVNLVVDSDHMYTAGDGTGRTIEVECPWGTQTMAEDILARVSAVQYKPFSAERALLDPAFEIGDAVTIGGVYSQIAGADCTYSGASLFTIEAPDLDEIDDEYPAQQTRQSSIKRQLAYTRSLITKTAEEIQLSVEGVDGRVSALSVTLDGVTIEGEDGVTRIRGSAIETGSITADKIAAHSITADRLVVGVIPTDTSQLTNGAGYQTATGVVSIVGGVVTADYIKALGVSATSLEGRVIVVNSGTITYAHMMMTTDSAGSRAFEIYGYGGLRLLSNGNVYINGGGATVLLQNSSVSVGPTLYLTNGTLIASDRDLKHDIEYDIEAYDAVFDSLKPSRFKYNDGTSDRYHTALIAQDVKDAVLSAGLTTQDFAGYCEMPIYAKDEDGNDTEEITGYTCALRYDEFIALNIRQIQLLKARVAELEAKL